MLVKSYYEKKYKKNCPNNLIYITTNAPSRSSTIVITLHIMEKFNINYSKKNIPTASIAQYKLILTSKIEKVRKRMRWKVLEFLGKLESNSNKNETYGFKSLKCSPAVEEMAQLENDFLLLIKNLEFTKAHNDFQMRLRDDTKEIKASNMMFGSADKSRHIYKMEKVEYKKLLQDNITKTYKKWNEKKLRDINFAAKKIVEKLLIVDRVEVMQETEAYITIKDHKDEFPNKMLCRLINPSKPNIGKISKTILDTINKNIVRSTEINQPKDTSNVLD